MFLLDGTTFHSGLAFKFGSNQHTISKERLDKLKKQLEFVEVVIVDEMSMVSADDLYHLHKRLQDVFDSKDDFGGRAVILLRDLLQLTSVQGEQIFKKPKLSKNRVLKSMTDNKSRPIGDLWNKCQVVYMKTNF